MIILIVKIDAAYIPETEKAGGGIVAYKNKGTLSFNHYIEIVGCKSPSQAEEAVLFYIIKHLNERVKRNSVIKTDCRYVSDKYSNINSFTVEWISRKHNSDAHKVAKKALTKKKKDIVLYDDLLNKISIL